jgi:soluble lytic murein transglycosylase-like protein
VENVYITYTVLPAEYTANTAEVDLLGDSLPQISIPGSTSGTGTASLPQGFPIDMTKAYQAQIVLNNGSQQLKITSDKQEVNILGTIPVTLGLTKQLAVKKNSINPNKLVIYAGPATTPAPNWSLNGNNTSGNPYNGRIEGNGLFRAIHFNPTNCSDPTKYLACTINANTGDRSGLVIIDVKPPLELGTTHNEFDSLIIQMANQYGMPPQLIKAQIQQESSSKFDPNAYRYEPHFDWAYISIGAYGKYLLETAPYSNYRLATPAGDLYNNGHSALAKGTLLSDADITPRNLYSLIDTNKDGFYSAWEIINANPKQNFAEPPSDIDFVAQTTISSSYGLMQIMWPTALVMGWNHKQGGSPHLLFDPATNLDIAVGYDDSLFKDLDTGRWDADWDCALARYNGSISPRLPDGTCPSNLNPNYVPNILNYEKNYLPQPIY